MHSASLAAEINKLTNGDKKMKKQNNIIATLAMALAKEHKISLAIFTRVFYHFILPAISTQGRMGLKGQDIPYQIRLYGLSARMHLISSVKTLICSEESDSVRSIYLKL